MVSVFVGYVMRVLACAFFLFSYSYLENISAWNNSGILASFMLMVYLTKLHGGFQVILAPILFSAQAFVAFDATVAAEDAILGFERSAIPSDMVVYSLFLVMMTQVLFSDIESLNGKHEGSVDVDNRKPYETEIRMLLMEKDPSQLGMVDDWLEKNKGFEQKLFARLQTKYGVAKSTINSDGGNDGNEGYEQAGSGGVSGSVGARSGTSSGNSSSMPWEQERDLFVQEIQRFLRTHDSKMLKHMPAMLSDYRDKEEDLLKELYDEYNMAYVPPPHKRRFGTSMSPMSHGVDPFQSSVDAHVEMARAEAQGTIQRQHQKYDNHYKR